MPQFIGSTLAPGRKGLTTLSVWKDEDTWTVYINDNGSDSATSGTLDTVQGRIDTWLEQVAERSGADSASEAGSRITELLSA